MTEAAHALTACELRQLLDYNQDTGHFTWRASRKNSIHAGAEAGWRDPNGYIRIRVRWRTHQAHRLAWLHVYGQWPARDIDHINMVRSDNRLANLRLATRSQNSANTNRRCDNTSGVRGVSWHKQSQKWAAYICVNGKPRHLGLFESIEDAAEAYRQESVRCFGEFGRI